MTKLKILFAIALLIPALAQASPITLGTWSTMPAADDDGTPFWDGATFDSTSFGVGHLIAQPGLEYLHDGSDGAVAFGFSDPLFSWTLLHNVTGRPGGILSYTPGGAFTYNSGFGISDSLATPGQYALFRVLQGASTRYILGVEDIPEVGDPVYDASDADYNDYVVSFTLQNPEQNPEPIPEPTVLALLGTALVGLGYRLKRATRTILGAIVVCLISSVAWGQSVVVDGDVTINSTRPLIFPVEEGTPGNGVVHAIKLGGAGEEDIFVSLHDAQPGTGPATNSRGLVLYSRQTTAALPVAHSSLFLSGWWWDPAFGLPIQRAIELENKVMLDGQAQFWLEEIVGSTPVMPGSGKPFMRFFRTPNLSFPTDNGHLATHDQPGAQVTLDARDTNDNVWRSFLTLTAGSTPTLSIVPPIGGTVKLRGTYFSNDGTIGLTKTCTRPITAATIRNGLITAVTCP